MSILSDKTIKELSLNNDLITPFVDTSISTLPNGNSCTSYGLSSYGYDIRLSNVFKIFYEVSKGNTTYILKDKNDKLIKHECLLSNNIIDPCKQQNIAHKTYTDIESIVIPPNGFILGVSEERIKIPRDILVVCMQKSTLARCGLEVIITPLEPEWEGNITLEIHNKANLPVVLHTGMGISQLLFFKGDLPCKTSYNDKAGKYQNQPKEPILAKPKS